MKTPPTLFTLPHRIKVERKRLGKNQLEMALLCGSSREMWGRYERGSHPIPANVLQALIDCGADALYLRTGNRAGATPQGAAAMAEARRAGADMALRSVRAETVQEVVQMLQSALADDRLLNDLAPISLQDLTLEEYALIMAYRRASPARKAVFMDLVYGVQRQE